MTHPLTPREKVARIVDPAAFLFTTDELMKGDTSQYDALRKADAILTALASGSGDHAELARLAEAAATHLAGPKLNADGFGLQIWGDSLKGGSTHVLDVRGWGYLTGGGHGALGLTDEEGIAAQRAIQAYAVAAWNAAPALLAENAALRVKVRTEIKLSVDNYVRATARATEAERKLAEADQVIRDIAETPYTGADWPRSRAATYLASKEAERG